MLQSFKGSALNDYYIALFLQLPPLTPSLCFRFVRVQRTDRFLILDLVQFFFFLFKNP